MKGTPGENHELALLHFLAGAYRHTSFNRIGLVALVTQKSFLTSRLAQTLRDDWACGRLRERGYVLHLAFLPNPRRRTPLIWRVKDNLGNSAGYLVLLALAGAIAGKGAARTPIAICALLGLINWVPVAIL